MSTTSSAMQATTAPTKPKTRLPVHVQHSNSPTWVSGATSTLTSAFSSDPVTAYILNHLETPLRLAALQKLFTLSSNAALLAGGELWSASTTSPTPVPSFQAAATIFPPGASLDNLGASSLPSLLWGGGLVPALSRIGIERFRSRMDAFGTATMPVKKSVFPNGETYFYVFLVGASAAHRGKGLAPGLIRKLQERARDEGKPIWLEASNEGARAVYLKLGFKDVQPLIYLGKGECDANGEVASGEEAMGVPMWPMVWWPEGEVKGAEA